MTPREARAEATFFTLIFILGLVFTAGVLGVTP